MVKLVDEVQADDKSYLWTDVQEKSSQVNQLYLQLEKEEIKEKKIKMTTVLGDILQGAVFLVLILRTDLRIRGILGLSDLASHLSVDQRNSSVPGYLKV